MDPALPTSDDQSDEGDAGVADLPKSDSHVIDALFRLPGVSKLADRIGIPEVRRRFLHMLPGLLPFALWLYPHEALWELPVRVWVVGLSVLLVHFGLFDFRAMQRKGETGDTSVISYAFCVIGTLAVAPTQPVFALLVLVVLAFGDGSATLGGMLLRGPKLPWNSDKSWSGLCCFVAAGGLMGTIVYWGELDVPFANAAAISFSVTACAAVAESLPLQINDNYRVGIATVIACFAIVEHNFQMVYMLVVAAAVAGLIVFLRRRRATAGES